MPGEQIHPKMDCAQHSRRADYATWLGIRLLRCVACGRYRGTVGQPGLLENVVNVILRRAGGDTQPVGDELVAQARGDEHRHILLAPRKVPKPGGASRVTARPRHANHDQLVPEVLRSFEVDRDPRTDGGVAGEVEDLSNGQGTSVASAQGLHRLADAL